MELHATPSLQPKSATNEVTNLYFRLVGALFWGVGLEEGRRLPGLRIEAPDVLGSDIHVCLSC